MTSKTHVIILCGGISKRWNNYLGIEKHFTKIEGISVIEHIINLLLNFDVVITILARQDNAQLFFNLNQSVFTISKEKSIMEFYKIKSTFDLWNNYGKTIILMGDVWYTYNAIKKILMSKTTCLQFWGRQRKNYHTKCRHGELFAISFYPNSHDKIKKASDILEDMILEQEIKIAGGWGIYNIISGLDNLMSKEKIIKGKALFSNFNNILDVTDDIDTPNDYENIKQALSVNKLTKIINSLKMYFFYFFITIYNIYYELISTFRNKII